nr:hypothetical protein 5 [Paracoccaceae bacterium]
MAVNFPLNPVDEQRYPDLAAGDPPLENGRVYVYDAAKGIWNIDTGEGSGEFLLKHGHIVDDCTTPVVYSWNEDTTFKVDGSNNITIDAPDGDFTVNSDWTYINAKEIVEVRADSDIVLDSSADIEVSAGDNYSELINRTIEDTARKEQITNKEYVDQRDHILQEEIIKIQEEINALAPSTERGIWKDAATQIPPEGYFSMRVQGGGVTADYTNANISLLVIHKTAANGSFHSFENDKIGDEIQLFDVEDRNYGVFEITGKDDQSNDDYVSFNVKHLGGLGGTNPDDDVIIRVYTPPSGGTASEFVRKLGDDMEGPLRFKDDGIIDGKDAQSMPEAPGDPDDPKYRAGLEIRTVADKPLAISHDGTYKSVLDIYRYDAAEPNSRGKTLSMYANGNVITPGYFQTSEYVRTPTLKSKDDEDLNIQRGSDVCITLKQNSSSNTNTHINTQLYVDSGHLHLDELSNNKGMISYQDQQRITLTARNDSATWNAGGGYFNYRYSSTNGVILYWGKDGIAFNSSRPDRQKIDIENWPVINVPDPVDEQDATNKRYVDLLSAKIEELEKKIANLSGGGDGTMFDAIVNTYTFELKDDSSDENNNKFYSTNNSSQWAEHADRIWQIGYGKSEPSYDGSYTSGFFLPQPWLDKQGLKLAPAYYSHSLWIDFDAVSGFKIGSYTNLEPIYGYPKAETFYGVPGYTFLFSERLYAGSTSKVYFTLRNKFEVVTNRMNILEYGTALGPDELGGYQQNILQFVGKNLWTEPSGAGTRSDKITFNSDNYHQNSTTAYYEYEALYDGTVYFREQVSSEQSYDKGTVYINGNTVVGPKSGSTSYEDHIFELKKGDKLKFEYKKDGSTHNNNDRFYVKYLWSEGYVPREDAS